MNNVENNQEPELKDNLTIVGELFNQYFAEIENSVPHFQHTLFDFQNEWFKAWKTIVGTNLSLQKEFALKTGCSVFLSEENRTLIESMNKGFMTVRSTQNKIILATIETMKKNILMWNNTFNIFADFNKNVMNYWISRLMEK